MRSRLLKLLEWLCPPELYEGIEGDLFEQFEADVKVFGVKKANRRFSWNIIRFMHPYLLLRKRFSVDVINTIMIGNYFKVAVRNIQKRKFYSFINAFGLSIGIAFCMLIYLFIMDERSFDQFHENKADIYRIEEKSYDTWDRAPKPFRRSVWVQAGLMQVLKDEIPEVTRATRFNPNGSGIFRYGDKVFTEELTYVDGDFFTMFSFPLLKGNPDKLFRDSKLEIVITPAITEKYFGAEDPIGKTVVIDLQGEKSFVVAGVISPAPANSSLEYAILIPQENRWGYERQVSQWGNFGTPTFVQLKPGADPSLFKRNLDKVLDKHMGAMLKEWREESAVPIPEDVKMLEYEFSQLPAWHLNTEVSWNKASDPKYSWILGGIALLILLIACINYISLALTTSASRKTEVGIRKVVGAQRNQLMYQFGFESFILVFISLVIAMVMVVLFLPAFNEYTDKGISLTTENIFPLSLAGLGLILLVGVLAGSYPSVFLSHFKPASVLKGRFTSRMQTGFTKPLVVLQFALSAFLIISSVIMYRQMQYITTKELGYIKIKYWRCPHKRDGIWKRTARCSVFANGPCKSQ